MVRQSFRSVSAPAVYPGSKGGKRWLLGLAAAAALGASACGSGGHRPPEQLVRARAFAVAAPGDWEIERGPKGISAAPKPGDETLVSISVFRLVKPYRPALWPRVVPELDRVARELADGLKATLDESRTVHVLGRRSRQYELSFTKDGDELRERITFFLYRRREFQLLCRWRKSDDEPQACGLLTRSFKPAGFG